jgi:hypothetical protein
MFSPVRGFCAGGGDALRRRRNLSVAVEADREGDMKTWFVSVLHFPADGAYYEAIRTASEFQNETQAKRFAALALNRGAEVEAGTLPGVVPKTRIYRQGAREWAQPFYVTVGLGAQRKSAGA